MPHDTLIDVWAVEGRFQHLVYSPRGEHEGVLIDTDGVPTQFVFDKHDTGAAAAFAQLAPGQRVTVEGSERPASPKGDGAHVVYDFHRLSEVDGQPLAPTHDDAPAEGRVLRINHARHGAPNGVVLDTGDFVHLKPEGFAQLALQPGDRVRAEGPAQPLADGRGRVIEAHTVNGTPLAAR
ncbi:MAG: hypothetical protein REJ24_05460 [Rhodocyclaceae bacterium]|nr:hypothetical protein [Rhodocyclaceae bacterium]